MPLLAFDLTSCINDSNECKEPEMPGSYTLRFRITTRSVKESRAADISGQEAGSGAENLINIDGGDIRYLIFDSDQKFIADITAETSTVAVNELFTIYDVLVKLDDPYFKNNINGTLDFYMVALANYKDWGITVPELKEGDELSSLFTNGLVMTVTPDAAKLINANGDAGEKMYFPMAGMQRFTIPGSFLLSTSEKAPYNVWHHMGKELNLLRALAKIEIIDKINFSKQVEEGNAEDPDNNSSDVSIKSVELYGYMNRGRLLPLMSEWNRGGVFETQQVTSPSVGGTAEYKTPPPFANPGIAGDLTNYSLSFVADPQAQNKQEDKCPVFSCYVYEYLLTNLAGNIQRPYFMVTLESTDNSTATPTTITVKRPFLMASYVAGVAQAHTTQLLRNYIYRFEISGVNQDFTLNWTVCPMDEASTSIGFN